MRHGTIVAVGAAAVLLTGCGDPGVRQLKAQLALETEAQRAFIAPYVGHSYFLIGAHRRYVCDRADYLVPLKTGPTPTICSPAGGRFTIDSYSGVEATLYDDEIRVHVTFDSGAAGYTGFKVGDQLSDYFTDHDTRYDAVAYPVFMVHLALKEAARRLKLPGAVIDMNPGQVLASAWGAPLSRKTHEICFHTDSCDTEEIWFYPENAQLTFVDGKVMDIIRG